MILDITSTFKPVVISGIVLSNKILMCVIMQLKLRTIYCNIAYQTISKGHFYLIESICVSQIQI